MTNFAPILNILPQAVVKRLRLLPREGEITVRQGQAVRATDVVGRANVRPKHFMLDLASGLGVARRETGSYLERDEGESVEQGDVIARRTGLLSRVVRAPVAGRIVLISDGYVMLEEAGEPFELLAGIPGEVSELVPDNGVVVEAIGALVQGVWGNGLIDFGVLTVLGDRPDSEMLPEQIDVELRGAVLLGGFCRTADVFRRATEQRLRGMVLGSMPSELIPTVRKLAFPVLLTDGFGVAGMNPAAYRLLSTNEKRDVAINAEPANPETGTRPEALIPLPGVQGIDEVGAVGRLEAGVRVRITRAPYLNVWGRIESIPLGKVVLPNGLRLPAARIVIDKGETVLVPLANLEIVESRG